MIFTYRRVLRCSSPVNPRVPLIQFFFNTVTFDVRIMKYWTFYRKRKTSDLRGVFTCRGALIYIAKMMKPFRWDFHESLNIYGR
ncbi:uncharacterized protein LOC143154894 isoform X2 [Ptiloglossa arizonensis]|uniref:uncharacterized protein LOC143154894 isoform X2 n=1 Tax=Ptiloglossa arizonensis TaxID=3350558 RepID=UPI003FA05FCB